ncbi:MAG TPA: T9SS type A sorting domain-containing protein [Bacteroidia bacterium]|nr:T9SS type A sorting domain-containing protein [Bacteroidia bacterium]
MTKKLYAVIFLFFIFINADRSFAQCTPNPNNTNLITPDTVTNFVSGTVAIPYTQIVYLHPPSDTTVMIGTIPVTIDPVDSIVLNSITNLPPGLSVACNPSNCNFLGGVSGCAKISGTPTTAGTYILNIIVTSYGKEATFGFSVYQTDTIQSYHITINVNSGIPVYDQSNFQLIEFGPDPVQEKLTLKINSPKPVDADFSIFNILGKSVYNKSTSLKQGINTIDFNAKNISAGVYILTLKKEPYLLTRRFVIGGK